MKVGQTIIANVEMSRGPVKLEGVILYISASKMYCNVVKGLHAGKKLWVDTSEVITHELLLRWT